MIAPKIENSFGITDTAAECLSQREYSQQPIISRLVKISYNTSSFLKKIYENKIAINEKLNSLSKISFRPPCHIPQNKFAGLLKSELIERLQGQSKILPGHELTDFRRERDGKVC